MTSLYKPCLFSLFVLLVAFQMPAGAQQSLSGKISDSHTSQPISGVSVFITDLQMVTVSGENGSYRFDHLPKTIVHVSFSSLGYRSVVKTVNLESDSSLDISLAPSSTELEEVLVTSNNSSLPANIPFSANSISQQDVRKYASPFVMGNLSYQPGIDKITIGNGIGKPVIRGLSFNQVLLYSQGTRIENQQWDDHHDLGISDVGIENVEVVRGPAALIYGADALGGALIFRDEKPAPAGTTVSKANFSFGSNTLGVNGDYGYRRTNNNGLFYGFTLGGSSQTSYLQGEREGEPIPGLEEFGDYAANSKFIHGIGKANIGLNRNWGTSKLSYSYFRQFIGIIEDESADSAFNAAKEANEQREREVEAPYQDVASQVVSMENTFVTGTSKVNMNLAYQSNDRKEYEPLPEKKKELAIGLLLNAMTYDVKWTSNAEKKTGFTIGSQGTFLKNENNGLEALVPDADVTDLAAYGLFRYDKDNLNLLGGIRIDSRQMEVESYEGGESGDYIYLLQSSGDTVVEPEADFEKEYTPFSFSLGASYHAGQHLLIKLNGATGFTAPNYAQLATFGKHEGAYRFEAGNANLDIEQNLQGDLGLTWENASVTFDINGFYNRVNNYIYLSNTGDSMIRVKSAFTDTLALYNYKQGDADLSGFEAGFDFHPRSATWFSIGATYSFTHGELAAGGNLPYMPADKLVAELKFRKEKLLGFQNTWCSLILSNYAKQEHVADYEVSTDGYSLLDVHVGGSFKLGKHMTQFDLFCTNLLNTGYYNQLSLVRNIGVMDMGRNIGITFHIP